MPLHARYPYLTGATLCAVAAVAFSGKAVIIKLAYRHGVDALTLLALRMLFSAPLFVALAWWSGRRREAQPLARKDLLAIAGLGLVGYYLSSYFDFLGLQYITASLERLVLFLYPTFVLLLSALLFGRRITARDVPAFALSYVGIAVVVLNDLRTQPGSAATGSLWVLGSALLYATYLIGSGRLVGRVGSLDGAADRPHLRGHPAHRRGERVDRGRPRAGRDDLARLRLPRRAHHDRAAGGSRAGSRGGADGFAARARARRLMRRKNARDARV